MAKLSLRISRYIKETYIAWLFIFLFFILIYIFLTINKFDTQQIKSNEKVIFYADNITPAHKTLIDKFNKTYEGQIKVVPIDLPFTKFTTNERKDPSEYTQPIIIIILCYYTMTQIHDTYTDTKK